MLHDEDLPVASVEGVKPEPQDDVEGYDDDGVAGGDMNDEHVRDAPAGQTGTMPGGNSTPS